MDEVSTVVAAPPAVVWALVSDLTRRGGWSPENTGGRWTQGATGPAPGARSVGWNRHGALRWPTPCRVVECDAPRRFAFTVAGSRMTWGWRLQPDGAERSAGGASLSTGTRPRQWRERTSRPSLPVRARTGSGLLGRDREALVVGGMRSTPAAVEAAAARS